MKIEIRYKEGTSIENTSKDKAVVTMTTMELIFLQDIIDVVKNDFKATKENVIIAKQLAKDIYEAKNAAKIKWVK